MNERNFERDKKWCPKCEEYQRYMMSVNHSFCTNCGTQMRLFSKKDQERFTEEVQRRRVYRTGS